MPSDTSESNAPSKGKSTVWGIISLSVLFALVKAFVGGPGTANKTRYENLPNVTYPKELEHHLFSHDAVLHVWKETLEKTKTEASSIQDALTRCAPSDKSGLEREQEMIKSELDLLQTFGKQLEKAQDTQTLRNLRKSIEGVGKQRAMMQKLFGKPNVPSPSLLPVESGESAGQTSTKPPN